MFAKKRKTMLPAQTYDELHLKAELNETKGALDCAYSNFENVVEPALIDSYIYELKAIQTRYSYLLERARCLEEQKKA